MKKFITEAPTANTHINIENHRDVHTIIHKFHSEPANAVFIIAALFFIMLFTGCEDFEIENAIDSETKEFPGVIYSNTATRSSDEGFWESWLGITLSNGVIVNTPWNPIATTSTVPHEFLEDIKYIDGWDIKYPLSESDMVTLGRRDTPYLIFHNRYTGILKVFSYLPKESFTANNNGIWKIETQNPTSLFAFQKSPISKITERQKETYYVSNITNNAARGFCIGWNCFQIELAYDPAQSGWMYIDAFSCNTVDISLTGNIQAETSGLITSSSGQNKYGAGVAKIAGNEAGNWIKNKIKDKTILSSILSEGVKEIISGGVGSVIGSVVGLFKSSTSSKSLQLTTNGTFKLEGDAIFTSTVGISPIQFNISPTNRRTYALSVTLRSSQISARIY